MSENDEKEAETLEQRHMRLFGARHKKQLEETAKLKARDCDRMELAERFEKELGREGSEFAIVDSGHLDDPLLVVKRPALVQYTKYEQSKHTPTDRYEFVAPSVVHPAIDVWNVLREKRVGLELHASNAMGSLMGVKTEEDGGK